MQIPAMVGVYSHPRPSITAVLSKAVVVTEIHSKCPLVLVDTMSKAIFYNSPAGYISLLVDKLPPLTFSITFSFK